MSCNFRPSWPIICGFCLALNFVLAQGVRHLASSPSPGTAENQDAVLLEFRDALTDFQKIVSTNHLRGWSQNAAAACGGANQTVTGDTSECSPENQIYRNADLNSWTGVTCSPTNQVVCIHLPGLAVQGGAAALLVLDGLPSLGYLNLAKNKLTGSLPPDLPTALPSLQILDLSYNAINSTLPPEWGAPGAWPKLEDLQLQDNELYGTLPEMWGSEESWNSLAILNLSDNQMQGSIPGSYSSNNSVLEALQTAVLQPGNSFCGTVPEGFPAVKATGVFVTGPTFDSISSFSSNCTPDSAIVVPVNWSGDNSGDDLSHAAIAGIITGEVLFGTFLLLFSGTIHRRYRWRHERSWVLFDWDVVADAKPKPFINFGARFGWGSKPLAAGGNGQFAADGFGFLPNGSHSPAKLSSKGHATEAGGETPPSASLAQAAQPAQPAAAQAGSNTSERHSLGSLQDMIWQDSLLPPDDVVIQQNADGTLRQLGNGSFGKVFKGVLQDVHEVAVKVFEGYRGQREQDLLLKEISILRSCRNKNIVQFFGVTFRDDDIWMIMELMDGNLFRHLARGHHCTWYFRGRTIALDIARGMHFLHSRRTIHMDLKSPNILLSSSGTAKIADVGLARVMGSESIANQVCAGTMHWMAPEVLINGRATEKADIFSFGVILWEICTAEAPTRGRMAAVSVPDECPEEVAKLIEWCMEEDPEKRPSALEIIQRIQSVPVTARPVPQPPWYAR